jgi:hypothetical protein
MDASLIAPCGMNCALCLAYQRGKNRCGGCHSDNIPSAHCRTCVIKKCEKRLQSGWEDCSPCEKPCLRLKQLDKRYRTKYNMSMLENLKTIRENGMASFLVWQKGKYTCPKCGELLCVHRIKCLKCGE